jgi:hypothetical protein
MILILSRIDNHTQQILNKELTCIDAFSTRDQQSFCLVPGPHGPKQ